jgi:hypothetical protein
MQKAAVRERAKRKGKEKGQRERAKRKGKEKGQRERVFSSS